MRTLYTVTTRRRDTPDIDGAYESFNVVASSAEEAIRKVRSVWEIDRKTYIDGVTRVAKVQA